jgi:hypothetical protein
MRSIAAIGAAIVTEQKQITAVDKRIAISDSNIAADAVVERNIQRDP